MTSLDMRGLTSITSIGVDFLAYCTGLTSFDTQGLTSVTSIGNDFLSGSTGLTLDGEKLRREILERNKKDSPLAAS